MFWIIFASALITTASILVASLNICAQVFLKSKCKIKSNTKVALTFDDGPHPTNTPELLDTLKALNIKATFFVIGERAHKYPEIIKRIVNEGHTLGQHSYYHRKNFGALSSTKIEKELQQSIDTIEQITGVRPSYFRPPFGVTNPNIAKAVKTLGLTSIGWSLRSYDTTYTPEMVVNKLTKKAKAGDIILMHDHLESTSQSVKTIVREYRKNGLDFVNLDDSIL